MGSPVTVNYAINGTAANTGDYATIANSVSIPSGQRSATVVISPIDDTLLEDTETVVLTLEPSPNYGIGTPASAQVDLADNDTAAVTVNNALAAEAMACCLPSP